MTSCSVKNQRPKFLFSELDVSFRSVPCLSQWQNNKGYNSFIKNHVTHEWNPHEACFQTSCRQQKSLPWLLHHLFSCHSLQPAAELGAWSCQSVSLEAQVNFEWHQGLQMVQFWYELEIIQMWQQNKFKSCSSLSYLCMKISKLTLINIKFYSKSEKNHSK